MMAGFRTTTIDDTETDSEYEAALARFAEQNPGTVTPKAVQMIGSMANGSTPRRIQGPTLTLGPGGSVGSYADVDPRLTPEEEAAQGPISRPPPPPSFLDRASMLAADVFTGDDLQARLAAGDESPRLNTALETLRKGAKGVARMTGLGQFLSGELPDVPLPEASAAPPPSAAAPPPPPAPAPTARAVPRPRKPLNIPLEPAPNFDMKVAPTPFLDEAEGGPLPKEHPAVAKALESIRGQAPESDLDAALRQSADRRLISGLTRAGAMAIGRGKGGAYDNLDREADRPLAELQLRRADAEAASGKAAQAAERDPNSQQSQQARALLARMAPDLARDPSFVSLSAERAKALFPWLKELGDREAQREALKAKGEEARLGRENALKVAGIRARGKGGTGGLKRVDLERFTQKAAQEIEGFSDMRDDLSTVLTSAEKEDVEGVGPGEGILPDLLTSAAGTANRRAARRLVENLLKAQSGLAASDREQVRKLASTSLSDRASDADWRAGARELAKFVQRGMASREAAFPPEAIDLLEQRGGTTSRSIPTGAPTSATGAPARVTSDADFDALPSGTEFVGPDGKRRRKP